MYKRKGYKYEKEGGIYTVPLEKKEECVSGEERDILIFGKRKVNTIGKYLQKRRRDISYISQKKEEYRYEKLCNFCEKHGRGRE